MWRTAWVVRSLSLKTKQNNVCIARVEIVKMMMLSNQSSRSPENLSRYRPQDHSIKYAATMNRQSDVQHTLPALSSSRNNKDTQSLPSKCWKNMPNPATTTKVDSHHHQRSTSINCNSNMIMPTSPQHRRLVVESDPTVEKPRRRRLTSVTDVIQSHFSFEEEDLQQETPASSFDDEEEEIMSSDDLLLDKGYHTDPCIMPVRKQPMSELIRWGSTTTRTTTTTTNHDSAREVVASSESSEDCSIEESVLEEILTKGTGLEQEEGLTEALSLYNKAVQEGLVGDTSSVAYLEYRMGTLLWKCGSYEKSLSLLKRARDAFESEGGLRVHLLAEIYFAVGRTLASLGKRDRARKYFMKALRNLEYDQFVDNNVRSEDQELYAKVLTQVANLLISNGCHEMASEVLSEAITMQRSILPSQHPDIAATMLAYGSLNEALHRYEYSAKCYLEALEIFRSSKSTNFASSVDISVALSNIGWLFYLTQDYSSALHSYEEALEVVVPVLGQMHRNVLSLRVQMGMVYAELGKHKSAIKMYRAAIDGQRSLLGDEHEDVALTLALVGSAYKEMGNFHKAIEFTAHALAMRQEIIGTASTIVGMTFAQLGDIYVEAGQLGDASHCFSSSLAIFYEQGLPSSDSRVNQVRESLAEIVETDALR